MLLKEKVLKSINDLPDEFSIDDLVERLIVLEKVEIGLKQAEEGKKVTTEEARQKLKNRLK